MKWPAPVVNVPPLLLKFQSVSVKPFKLNAPLLIAMLASFANWLLAPHCSVPPLIRTSWYRYFHRPRLHSRPPT